MGTKEQEFINALCEVMIRCSLSTGHANTFNELLEELEDQLSSRTQPPANAELVE